MVITKELIEKINELARKQRTVGLTPAEKDEQHQLRQQYLKGIRGQVVDALSRIKYVEDEPCSCGCNDHQQEHKHDNNCGCHNHKGKGHIH